MDTLGSILNPILDFLKAGFDKVNAWQGLLIALFAVVLMRKWADLFLIAAGAVVVYLLVAFATPIVSHPQAIRLEDTKLPNVMTSSFWIDAASFFVGFVIIISMFFAVKAVAFSGRGGAKKKAH
jgi:uncharacterized membrane protein YkvI